MKKLILPAIFFQASWACLGQEYLGADAVTKLLTEKAGEKVTQKKADPLEDLRQKVKVLQENGRRLPVEEAARQWVTVLNAFLTIPQEQLYSVRAREDRLDFDQIMMALPPPAAWDEIGKLVQSRKSAKPLEDAALRLLLAVLRGDATERTQTLADTKKAVETQKDLDSSQREFLLAHLPEIEVQLEQLAGSELSKLRAFETSLSKYEARNVQWMERHGSLLAVPDLVRFADEKTAKDLLQRVLKLEAITPSFEGNRTRQLAADLALKNMATMKQPLWELVQTLQDAKLFEAMAAKFPKDQSSEYRSAQRVYLLSLIAAGRSEEAVKLTQELLETDADNSQHLFSSSLDDMQSQGLGQQVRAFLHQMLSREPQMAFWSDYIQLSAHQNASAEALKLLQQSLAKPKLTTKARAEIQSHLYEALLAADQREEGVRLLRELIQLGAIQKASDGQNAAEETRQRWEQVGVHVTPEMMRSFQADARGRTDDSDYEHVRLCQKLATLGRLLNRPELIAEAVEAAQKTLEQTQEKEGAKVQIVHALVALLLKYDRGVQAEKVLTDYLADAVKEKEESQRRGERRDLDESLGCLALIYQKAGKPADALAVLENLSFWQGPDLAAYESTSIDDTPLLLIAAEALAATNRKEDAQRVIRRAIQDYPANDAAYALLLKLGSERPLVDVLDELAQRDRFQERPLIWKARVLLDAGQLDEAEKAVRKAISIDPSDGEQGQGDRMRAYAVLADVLEKKGDAATAKIMRGAVSAIRKSEDADDWWAAGLLSEAVKRYEAALLDFADAYCIQSRLALRYSDLGNFDKAEQHYLRAFELMPESFGRVESHCFGCEGAFRGERAQSVADKVFTRLASLPPVKPQVHYLLGYLRQSQSRYAEAAEAFRQAVKADPDYLNAWSKLYDLAEEASLTREEQEHAALQIFRLDPAGHHSSSRLQQLTDLRQVWSTILEAEKELPKMETGPLLPLPAAKARIEDLKASQGSNAWNSWSYPTLFSRRNDLRQHLTENTLVQYAIRFLSQVSNR